MRAADWVSLAFFSFFSVLAWVRPIESRRRWGATAFGVGGLALVAASIFAPGFAPAELAAILQDWLPAPLMLLAYWQAGQFFTAPNPKLQAWLESLDQRWLGRVFPLFARRSPAGAYLEFAYLFCYPLVPLALGTLYAAGLRGFAGEFWGVVVPASYFCYAMVPFFQTLPPRAHEEAQRFGQAAGGLRNLNLGILRRASIQANTFPSAHVAASLAASLAVLWHLPGIGGVLLWISLSVAAAAVLRRYHYALDILAGAAVAVASFLAFVWLVA